MKKYGVLNSEITAVLAKLGHTNTIVIADCGLPIPDGVQRIDLAIDLGKPAFLEVLQVVADDMQIEKVTLAEEIAFYNELVQQGVQNIVTEASYEYVSHEQFISS